MIMRCLHDPKAVGCLITVTSSTKKPWVTTARQPVSCVQNCDVSKSQGQESLDPWISAVLCTFCIVLTMWDLMIYILQA